MPSMSAAPNHGLLQQQSQTLLKALPFMLVVELLVAVAVAWLYWGSSPDWQVAAWLLAGGALLAWRWLSRHSLESAKGSSKELYRQLLLAALSGALPFAVSAPLFNPLASLSAHSIFQLNMFVGLLASLAIFASVSYAADRWLAVVYILVLLTPVAVLGVFYSLAKEQPLHALMLPMVIGVLLLAARRMHRFSHRLLASELRNRSLIQYLESSRTDAEKLSEKLAKEIFDRRETRQRLQDAKVRLESMVTERTQALEQTNEELSTTSQRLQLALDASRISVWDWDIAHNKGYQSGFEQLFGYPLKPGVNPHEQVRALLHPDDLPMVRKVLLRHLKEQSIYFQCQYRAKHKDGDWHWYEDQGQVVSRDANRRATHMTGTRRDITAEQFEKEQRRLATTVFDNAPEGIEVFDPEMRFLAVNDSFTRITGFEESEVLGYSILEFGDAENRKLYADIFAVLQKEGLWRGDIIQPRKSGETYFMRVQLHAVYNEDNELTNYVGMLSDVSALKKDREELQFLSAHDRLTGLSNRDHFQAGLQRSLPVARLKRQQMALLYIDLDRFKPINDSLGHEVGDAVLKTCAERLRECDLDDKQVARIDSDEFTVMTSYTEEAELERLCKRIIDAIRRPIIQAGQELLLGASIGISLFPQTAKDPQSLMNQADIAMHQSKRMGGNNWQFFREDMHMASIEQLALETSLRKALSRNEFVVYYQPKLDLRDGSIRGAEALIRWQHPTMGLLSPGAFIPLAEEAGLITDIGAWVLNEACRQTAQWQRQGLALTTAVNLSAQQFLSTDVTQLVASALDDNQLAAGGLQMELTETLLMDDVDSNAEALHRLRDLGVSLALDDFGTGYSSLSYLKRFPIDELKIDRAFVMDLENSQDDAAIVQAIITMAQSLDLKVIAEGVETDGQLEALRDMGCDMVQGYLISRPVPAAEFEVMLFEQRQRLTLNHLGH